MQLLNDMDFEFIVKKLTTLLLLKGYTISTVEQCTCGLIGAAIASQEYPQRWYKGTITAYTEEEIKKILNIQPYIIEKNGLVSSQVAQQMALEVLYKYDTNIVISAIGSIDGYGKDVQICVGEYNKKAISFSYKKIMMGSNRSKNLETIINESLLLAIEHLEGNGG